MKKTLLGTQQDDTPSFHGSLGTATRFSEHEQERKPIAFFFLSIRDPRTHVFQQPQPTSIPMSALRTRWKGEQDMFTSGLPGTRIPTGWGPKEESAALAPLW